MLKSTHDPLERSFDVIVLDLDGVVYIGGEPVAHAADALQQVVRDGGSLAYVTNNASRTPELVADRLVAMGMPAVAGDVVTSAQAAARLVNQQVPADSQVFVIGGRGLEQALIEQGLRPVSEAGTDVAAVVQGYGPEVPWKQVLAGAILVRDGLPWVASNTDMTIPTANGIGPGNGTLVKLIADYAGRAPQVAGKPEAPLLEETLLRVGGDRPLMVGDRLDTDIEGANRLGWGSLLVMTGVTGLAELAGAPRELRPAYIAADLRGLHQPHSSPTRHEEKWRCGGWSAAIEGDALAVTGEGSASDWWRVAAACSWQHLDQTGDVALTTSLEPPR